MSAASTVRRLLPVIALAAVASAVHEASPAETGACLLAAPTILATALAHMSHCASAAQVPRAQRYEREVTQFPQHHHPGYISYLGYRVSSLVSGSPP